MRFDQKPGRTEQSAKAAASHTGSLAGSDDIFALFDAASHERIPSLFFPFNEKKFEKR
jgi:acyl-CoA synthetase (NDP forming)